MPPFFWARDQHRTAVIDSGLDAPHRPGMTAKYFLRRHCAPCNRIGGLNPSHLWGGWPIESGANDVPGGGAFRERGIRASACVQPG
jgi:hypothetical protein